MPYKIIRHPQVNSLADAEVVGETDDWPKIIADIEGRQEEVKNGVTFEIIWEEE